MEVRRHLVHMPAHIQAHEHSCFVSTHNTSVRPLSSKARRQRPTRSSATERLEVQTRPRSRLARLLRSKPPLRRHTLAIGETPRLSLSLSLSLSPEPDPHPHLTSALYVSYDTDAVPDKEKRCGP